LIAGVAPAFIDQRQGELLFGDAAMLSLEQSSDGDRILVERLAPARLPFHVYGSGLVARALVKGLVDLPFDVRWLDRSPGHFPREVPLGVTHAVYDELAMVARDAPAGSLHAVMTADHDLDLAICKTLLEANEFAYLGVIGSRVKRERLEAKLREEGVEQRALDRMSCPIGISGIRSKNPSVIAISIAADALLRIELG
jgi:xanthine dehydrogenase accessory factor